MIPPRSKDKRRNQSYAAFALNILLQVAQTRGPRRFENALKLKILNKINYFGQQQRII